MFVQPAAGVRDDCSPRDIVELLDILEANPVKVRALRCTGTRAFVYFFEDLTPGRHEVRSSWSKLFAGALHQPSLQLDKIVQQIRISPPAHRRCRLFRSLAIERAIRQHFVHYGP